MNASGEELVPLNLRGPRRSSLPNAWRGFDHGAGPLKVYFKPLALSTFVSSVQNSPRRIPTSDQEEQEHAAQFVLERLCAIIFRERRRCH